MPRDPSGVYSLPVGYRATAGEPAIASQHNLPLEDLAASMSGSLPRNGSAPMLADLPMGGFKVTGSANATNPTDLITLAQTTAAIAAVAMPPGIVSPFAGSSAPSGWLVCNGQAVSRTTYAALFATIATTYGGGDGSTTFNVPDLRGEFVRGLDAGRDVDAARALGTAQAADIAAHGHTTSVSVTDPGHTHNIAKWGVNFASGGATIEPFAASAGGAGSDAVTRSATTGIAVAVTVNNSTGTETRPRNVALNFIIKT